MAMRDAAHYSPPNIANLVRLRTMRKFVVIVTSLMRIGTAYAVPTYCSITLLAVYTPSLLPSLGSYSSHASFSAYAALQRIRFI